ncbi:MAG: hypothetical protein BWX50_01164 [Euryarchaeota archaeon ADurb.Bin009]|nr:MAG: hypothetical protein BWX50_01164 [Euryarchaeota archaeon ADurb.Bin009]
MDVSVAADDDRPAVDERGRVVAGIPGDPDQPALHAAPLAAGRRAQVVPGVPVDDQFAAFHPYAAERVDVPFDVNLPALHPAADVHVGVAFDDDLACGHLLADPLHTGAVPAKDDLRIGRGCSAVARDREVLPERALLFSLPDVEGGYLGCRLAGNVVRRDVLPLKIEFGGIYQGDSYCLHASRHLTVSYRPRSPAGCGGAHRRAGSS